MSKKADDLKARIGDASAKLRELEKELKAVLIEDSGIWIGAIVEKKNGNGEQFIVRGIDVWYGTSVALKVSPRKKNGDWGLNVIGLYGDWKLAQTPS